ncbi:MAG: guanine deaminase [Pseudomonadota bacterium]
MQPTLHLGQTLEFPSNPFHAGVESIHHRSHGAVLVSGGRIEAVGEATALRAAHPLAQINDHGRHVILPGFVDAHAHYSQTAIIASWGKRLIDWLNTYTFPEEMRFEDPGYAAEVAGRYLDLNLSNGITTACAYCTIHPTSVDALMDAAQRRGMAMVAGKVMMDRNAPEGLRDTAQRGFDESAALIARWHKTDRLRYAITPRFAPTSSPEQLEAAGALFAAHPSCAMQTHLSEQLEEIAWVRDLFPEACDYFDVYARFGLVGPGAIMGHAIHLSDREWEAITETGTAIAHCPTSNTFIGSGLFQMARAQAAQIPVGLATDVGGGSSFSMLRTMAAAYEVGQLVGRAIHPGELLWLATAGAAETLRLGDQIGRLAPGMAADLVVLDLASTPVIAQRTAQAEDIWEALFPTIMLGDDRAIAQVLIAGLPQP